MKWVFLAALLVLLSHPAFGQISENFQLEGRIVSQANLTSENFSLVQNITTRENISSPSFSLISEIISSVARIIAPQPTQAPSQQQPAAAGGGGGAPAPAAIPKAAELKADFRLSVEKITERLNAKEQKVIEIEVENTGEKDITVDVIAEGEIKNSIVLDKGRFDLKKGSKETVRLKIIAPDTPGEILIGDIVFQGGGVSKKIQTTIIAIALTEKLLDLKVEASRKEVFAGEEIGAQITIFNLGRAGRVDLVLEYSIANGKVLASGKETLAVETQTSVYRTLRVPDNAEPGSYIFRAVATYENQSVVSEDRFSVAEKQQPFASPAWANLVILLTVLAALVFIWLLKHRKRKNRRRRHKGLRHL